MSTPIVSLVDVSKSFGTVPAVASLTLDIVAGEVFALLGGSGSGKTTVLRMIAGFETPTTGRILIDGVDMVGVPPYARPTNLMFQSYALFPHMTVEHNVAYGLQREGMAKAEVARRVTDMLALVRLDGLGGRKPHQLSGGQRQRVALARALVKRPKLLLLDEPLGALDRKLREETQGELRQLQRDLGTTFLIVTHDQEEAMTLATRIAVMDQGRVEQVGTPGDVYGSPASLRVAEFLGLANLIPARVTAAEGGRLHLSSPAAGCDLIADGAGMTGDVVCVLRPEAIRLNGRATGANAVAAVVEDAVCTGAVTQYRLRLPGGLIARAVGIGPQALDRGQTVTASWEASALTVLLR
jgi:putrescine transport system ATP-binding protein